MKEKKNFSTYEVRVYKINDEYSVECYDEEKDGKVFTMFYITNGTQKMFSYGCQVKDRPEEEDLARFIFEEDLDTFEEELSVLNEYWDEQFELKNDIK